MDVQEALITRRTVHKFLPGDLPEDTLRDALDAAHHAPNHKFTVPWRFTVVGPETRRTLVPIGVRVKNDRKPLRDGQESAIRHKLLQATGLVVVSRVLCADSFQAREDYAACACAIQNMMVSLHARGFASKWTTGAVTRDAEAYDALSIDREVEEVIGWIWIGHPETVKPAVRPPLDDVVRHVP